MNTKKIQIVGSTGLVSYNPQEITDEQKAQARDNIGIYIATDEEIIDLLIEEDMLPAVCDTNGDILSDENENILLW